VSPSSEAICHCDQGDPAVAHETVNHITSPVCKGWFDLAWTMG
jgi:hypothetical protein